VIITLDIHVFPSLRCTSVSPLQRIVNLGRTIDRPFFFIFFRPSFIPVTKELQRVIAFKLHQGNSWRRYYTERTVLLKYLKI